MWKNQKGKIKKNTLNKKIVDAGEDENLTFFVYRLLHKNCQEA